MKPVQVMFDEELLKRLAESDEVRQRGRSEVVRRAVDDYLRRREQEDIANRYRDAYSDTRSLGEELEGWTDEGVWPDE